MTMFEMLEMDPPKLLFSIAEDGTLTLPDDLTLEEARKVIAELAASYVMEYRSRQSLGASVVGFIKALPETWE